MASPADVAPEENETPLPLLETTPVVFVLVFFVHWFCFLIQITSVISAASFSFLFYSSV